MQHGETYERDVPSAIRREVLRCRHAHIAAIQSGDSDSDPAVLVAVAICDVPYADWRANMVSSLPQCEAGILAPCWVGLLTGACPHRALLEGGA